MPLTTFEWGAQACYGTIVIGVLATLRALIGKVQSMNRALLKARLVENRRMEACLVALRAMAGPPVIVIAPEVEALREHSGDVFFANLEHGSKTCDHLGTLGVGV